jgi:hypothetical protein
MKTDNSKSRVGEMRNAYKILDGNLKGRNYVARPRWRRKGNIRMDLREIVWKRDDWIHLAENRDH